MAHVAVSTRKPAGQEKTGKTRFGPQGHPLCWTDTMTYERSPQAVSSLRFNFGRGTLLGDNLSHD